ncbi:MAG: hypothetical protein AB7I37_10080 [Pirellulales bacterium]
MPENPSSLAAIAAQIRDNNRRRRKTVLWLSGGAAASVLCAVLAAIWPEGRMLLNAGAFIWIAVGLTFVAVAMTVKAGHERQLLDSARQLGLSLALELRADQAGPLFQLPILPSRVLASEVLEALFGDYQGRPVVAARLRGGTGDDAINLRVVALVDGGHDLPEFTLSPEDYLLDKLAHLWGHADIDFAGSEDEAAFSRLYRLRGMDEAAVRSAFGPATIGYFAGHPGWCLHVAGGWLVAYRRDTFNVLISPSVDEIREQLDALLAIRAAFEQD